MKFELLDNALDFILTAIEHAEQDNVRSLKYSLLHFVSGVELILKERLRKEHWTLLFSNVDKATQESMKSGDFKSIDFNEAMIRVKNICSFNFGRWDNILRSLRDKRNKLEHFQFSGTKEEVISNLVQGWSFVLDFIHDQLSDGLTEEEKSYVGQIRTRMVENEEFIKNRLKEILPIIEQKIKSFVPVINCPQCFQKTLIIEENNPSCIFCRYSAQKNEVIDRWLTIFYGYRYIDPKARMTEPVTFDCPECGCNTFVKIPDENIKPPEPAWICFQCGFTTQWDKVKFCNRCCQPFIQSAKDMDFCDDCWREIVKD